MFAVSLQAPWLALAADWQDSPMFEPLPEHGVSEPATAGERLAWIMLLCHAKTKGRGGKVSLRKNAFAQHYRLSTRAVEGMLVRAQKCAALEVNGDLVSVTNWRTYQQRAYESKRSDSSESQVNTATKHQPPSTTKKPPTPFRPTVDQVRAYCLERKNSVNPQLFVDHYEANGWVQGNRGKPIQDWKAAVRTWEQNERNAANSDGKARLPTAEEDAQWKP